MAIKKSLYRRKYSPLEKTWRAISSTSQFYIQLVLDYTEIPDFIDWETVARTVTEANPGCAIQPKSILIWQYWLHHGKPFAVIRKKTGLTLTSELQLLPSSLNDEKGLMCELWIIEHPDGVAMVFRATHSAMDGKGVLHWAEETCRAIANQPLKGTNTLQSEIELVSDFDIKRRQLALKDSYIPLTTRQSDRPRRFYLLTRPNSARDTMPALINVLREYATINACGTIRIAIPSDLRKHKKNTFTTGNLTNGINLDITDNLSSDEINSSLKKALHNKADCEISKTSLYMNAIPLWAIATVCKIKAAIMARKNRYTNTANVSNLGDLNEKDFEIHGKTPTKAFVISPESNIFPLFICITGISATSHIAVVIPKNLQGSATELITYLCNRLDAIELR